MNFKNLYFLPHPVSVHQKEGAQLAGLNFENGNWISVAEAGEKYSGLYSHKGQSYDILYSVNGREEGSSFASQEEINEIIKKISGE